MLMTKEEIEIEICMAVELKEFYFKTIDESPFSNLMFQYWFGVEIGLCLALGKIKPSLTDSFYGMPYHEYYYRCMGFFWNLNLTGYGWITNKIQY